MIKWQYLKMSLSYKNNMFLEGFENKVVPRQHISAGSNHGFKPADRYLNGHRWSFDTLFQQL